MSRKKQESKHSKESTKKETNKKSTKCKKSRIEKQDDIEYKPAKKQKKTKKKSLFGWLIGQVFFTLFIFILIVGIIFCVLTYKNGFSIKGALMTACFVDSEDIENLEPINIVLLGISEDLDSRLTDTIILCSYNPKTSDVSMISIPRDTFVGKNIESAKGNDKINVLFYKSHEKFLKEISKISGIDVEYYAVINNDALIKIVDIMGGVDFDVPINMNYDDPTQDLHIHLEKGMQHIDGEKAEQLLRFRHNNDRTSYPGNYGDNDFGRMKTQRAFIEETAKQLICFKNIFNAKKIYDTVMENIDTNYNIKEVKKYIPTLADFKFEKITSNQLPGKSEKHNDIWFFVRDSKGTQKLIKELGIK